MNEAQLHLLFNHFPIIGLYIATGVFLGSLIFKSTEGRKVGLLLLAFACLLSVPSHFTGEGAEEIVEKWPGVEHSVIHEHEEAAEWFIVWMSVLGVISLASFILLWLKNYFPRWLVMVIAVFSVFCCVVAFNVGHSGGLIRHPELTEGAPPSAVDDHDEDHE